LGTLAAYDYIYSFWSDQYEHKLEYIGFTRRWERIVLRGTYDSRRFLAFYLSQGVLQAAFGLNRGGDPELEADAELSACRALIRGRTTVAEAALADERVDLWSLTP
jgi:3-phenylpropionate/trans-cinnamate dioxygenase ferredoxin reductase subunit